jgi:hypothetical protein
VLFRTILILIVLAFLGFLLWAMFGHPSPPCPGSQGCDLTPLL